MQPPADKQDRKVSSSCQCSSGSCGEGMHRRDVLKLSGLVAAGALTSPRSIMAGPFTADDFEKLVPADKRLSDAWIRSLFERGKPEWYSGDELKYIGMPIGGICCGHVYLGGDGRLWHWDIFNEGIRTGSQHYKAPMPVAPKVDISFALQIQSGHGKIVRSLDQTGFPKVRFRGVYPLGIVDYVDASLPVRVSLEAFSPFIPLDVERSSLPLTVMRYTVRNTSASEASIAITGAMANPVLHNSGNGGEAEFVNTILRRAGATCLHCTAEKRDRPPASNRRPDIVFDDFEAATYENWDVEGTAFGSAPIKIKQIPKYQGDVAGHGEQVVNSHNTRQGEDVVGGDAHVGSMTSKPFQIQRSYIRVLIGGGSHKGQTELQLLIDDKVVATLTGRNNNRMRLNALNVQEYEGKTARLRIIDQRTGGWGNIGVDYIVFSDKPVGPPTALENRPDMGDMTLALLEDSDGAFASALVADDTAASLFAGGDETARSATAIRPKGVVGKRVSLAPGEQATISFAVAWRFPNVSMPVDHGHYYAKRFPSSLNALEFLTSDHQALYESTRCWYETWYDSTLPYWLLDRTFINTSILATSTCLRMESGRFWGWEGVRCCPGTCSHVWHYAQAVGRVFPELERIVRERVDFGLAFQPDGRIFYRAEFGKREAIDGQCGTILRVYREHTMTSDAAFLSRVWPRVKKSIQYLITQDGDDNGVLEGEQYNTLDASWYGPISWISSLYLAALRAGAAMAEEMNDADFAATCTQLADRGGDWLCQNLFNGEYFYQQRDPKHPEAIGSGIGCHIDQVFGQGWTHQLALPRVLPKEQTTTALKSLWRYNFTPDVGPYRERFQTGRWYAMPGEAGLIMCTFPKGGEREARGGKPTHGFAGYLNECMNGFEYQAAGHMIAEGLVQEGLAVVRAIHDRYHPSRRNPYNEIECGDHYARSMASFGVYVSLCGFQHHGPKGHIGFAPKITPHHFKAAFIAAEGWGTFQQTIQDGRQTATVTLKSGKLRLRTVSLERPADSVAKQLRVVLGERSIDSTLLLEDRDTIIQLKEDIVLTPDTSLVVELS